jgi:putrescine aminotransferase
MPLGGVMVGDRVADVLLSHEGEFAHGLTCSGHPVACAAGIATLRVLRKNRIIEGTASTIAPYFQERLQTLRDHRIVGEVRGLGMLGAVELVRDKHSRQRLAPDTAGAVYCRNRANSGGLMVRQTGDAMIMAPPLICKRKEIDTLVEMLARALDETAAHFGIY